MTAPLGLEPRDAGPEALEPVVAFDDGPQLERARLRCADCLPRPAATDPSLYATGR
ncbi:hypothetical protein [Plantactinospora sp. KBS50]|uniref:hypothetical protein n=1 Tax=Plantactinospora sp. KBS50 TaxID=2024580 RepID=UPI0012FE3E9A|nr:hypothetical protein [Plantactinospora sp. KBS50]